MATAIRGDVGKIMFHNAAGTEADVAGTRSWSLTINKDTHETTAQGDTSKSFRCVSLFCRFMGIFIYS